MANYHTKIHAIQTLQNISRKNDSFKNRVFLATLYDKNKPIQLTQLNVLCYGASYYRFLLEFQQRLDLIWLYSGFVPCTRHSGRVICFYYYVSYDALTDAIWK